MSSQYSDVLIVALGSVPSTPSTPTKNLLLSNGTSIYVQWPGIVGDTLSIYGYELWADSGHFDAFNLIFDGKELPGVTSFLMTNVSYGLNYQVKVRALNFNGFGLFSPIALLNTCTSPSNIDLPEIISVSI
jgi:hypothetical protein